MNVAITFYSISRDLTGVPSLALEMPDGSRLEDVLKRIYTEIPALDGIRSSIMYTVGLEYAAPQTPLHEGSEIAFIPPVQGG